MTRGLVHNRLILGGINNNSNAEGPIDNMVSSNRSVKSNVVAPGILKIGPKLSSFPYMVELAPLI